MRRRLACLLAVLALLAAPACGDDDDGDAGSGDDTERPTTSADAPDSAQVAMKNFEFDPKAVEVPADGAALRLVNDSSAAHTFTVDELKVDQEVAAGNQVEVLVKAPDAAVTFYCRFHRASGMEGTLEPKA